MYSIKSMLPNEIGFLKYRFSNSEADSADPKSKPILKFATTTDEKTFIDAFTLHENGLVLLAKSADQEVWSNRKPIFNTVDGKIVVTFENE